MSVGWWILLAHVVGIVVSVRPFAKVEADEYPYYCNEGRVSKSEPCERWHYDCGIRDAQSIGAAAIASSAAWPLVVAVWLLSATWTGLTEFVGRLAATSRVDQRRMAELERELGIDDA